MRRGSGRKRPECEQNQEAAGRQEWHSCEQVGTVDGVETKPLACSRRKGKDAPTADIDARGSSGHPCRSTSPSNGRKGAPFPGPGGSRSGRLVADDRSRTTRARTSAHGSSKQQPPTAHRRSWMASATQRKSGDRCWVSVTPCTTCKTLTLDRPPSVAEGEVWEPSTAVHARIVRSCRTRMKALDDLRRSGETVGQAYRPIDRQDPPAILIRTGFRGEPVYFRR